jgi:acetolactate synthase-1/2/3 large subunit
MAISAVDSADPLSLQMLGMHGARMQTTPSKDCDFVIAVASRFDESRCRKAKEWAPASEMPLRTSISISQNWGR